MQDNTVLRFQKGDKESYRLLFNTFYPIMCLFAKNFINDYNDAEDITQETFIELWHQRIKFKTLNQIKAYLYLAVKNRCLNFKKHQFVKEKYTKTALIDNEPPFEEMIIEAEVIQNLNNAIDSLPRQQKKVILQSLQGLVNSEIAENLQITINTVKFHKKSAYKQLREKLGNSSLFLAILF